MTIYKGPMSLLFITTGDFSLLGLDVVLNGTWGDVIPGIPIDAWENFAQPTTDRK